MIAALTVALVSAPAWAHGASVSIRTPVYGAGTIAVGEPYGNWHHHGKQCRYLPGHYETFYQQVWVPGHYKQNYVQPVYRQKHIHGVTVTVLVSNGYSAQVWVPGHYKTVTRQVWRDAYWACGH
jgi:hypothetical protein